jgi:hypothetical protein
MAGVISNTVQAILRSRLTAQQIENRIREQVAEQVRLYERGRRLHGLLCLARDIQRLRATFGANNDVAYRFAPLESTIEDLLDSIELVDVKPVVG